MKSELDNDRWKAVAARDQRADGSFFYAVRSTGVFCRPGCASRLPNPKNVVFFDTPIQAQLAGFRACRRCRPNKAMEHDPQIEPLIRACRFIEEPAMTATLSQIASHVKLSRAHVHRLFRKHLGVTPKEYAAAHRTKRLQRELASGRSVVNAIYAAGFESSSRCYTQSASALGMTPRQYRDGGRAARIHYALADCALGRVLVAVTEKGVCRIAFGNRDGDLKAELKTVFPAAEEVANDAAFGKLLAKVLAFIESPAPRCPFPLDIRGTVFQQKVWRALQAIPPGSTCSYAELAGAIGQPSAARAVASACAANTLAVAIPCHRTVRTGGALSGYRWGVQRKKTLLEREAAPRR